MAGGRAPASLHRSPVRSGAVRPRPTVTAPPPRVGDDVSDRVLAGLAAHAGREPYVPYVPGKAPCGHAAVALGSPPSPGRAVLRKAQHVALERLAAAEAELEMLAAKERAAAEAPLAPLPVAVGCDSGAAPAPPVAPVPVARPAALPHEIPAAAAAPEAAASGYTGRGSAAERIAAAKAALEDLAATAKLTEELNARLAASPERKRSPQMFTQTATLRSMSELSFRGSLPSEPNRTMPLPPMQMDFTMDRATQTTHAPHALPGQRQRLSLGAGVKRVDSVTTEGARSVDTPLAPPEIVCEPPPNDGPARPSESGLLDPPKAEPPTSSFTPSDWTMAAGEMDTSFGVRRVEDLLRQHEDHLATNSRDGLVVEAEANEDARAQESPTRTGTGLGSGQGFLGETLAVSRTTISNLTAHFNNTPTAHEDMSVVMFSETFLRKANLADLNLSVMLFENESTVALNFTSTQDTLGVTWVYPDGKNVVAQSIAPNSLGARLRLNPGFRLKEVAGQPVPPSGGPTPDELIAQALEDGNGTDVTIKISETLMADGPLQSPPAASLDANDAAGATGAEPTELARQDDGVAALEASLCSAQEEAARAEGLQKQLEAALADHAATSENLTLCKDVLREHEAELEKALAELAMFQARVKQDEDAAALEGRLRSAEVDLERARAAAARMEDEQQVALEAANTTQRQLRQAVAEAEKRARDLERNGDARVADVEARAAERISALEEQLSVAADADILHQEELERRLRAVEKRARDAAAATAADTEAHAAQRVSELEGQLREMEGTADSSGRRQQRLEEQLRAAEERVRDTDARVADIEARTAQRVEKLEAQLRDAQGAADESSRRHRSVEEQLRATEARARSAAADGDTRVADVEARAARRVNELEGQIAYALQEEAEHAAALGRAGDAHKIEVGALREHFDALLRGEADERQTLLSRVAHLEAQLREWERMDSPQSLLAPAQVHRGGGASSVHSALSGQVSVGSGKSGQRRRPGSVLYLDTIAPPADTALHECWSPVRLGSRCGSTPGTARPKSAGDAKLLACGDLFLDKRLAQEPVDRYRSPSEAWPVTPQSLRLGLGKLKSFSTEPDDAAGTAERVMYPIPPQQDRAAANRPVLPIAGGEKLWGAIDSTEEEGMDVSLLTLGQTMSRVDTAAAKATSAAAGPGQGKLSLEPAFKTFDVVEDSGGEPSVSSERLGAVEVGGGLASDDDDDDDGDRDGAPDNRWHDLTPSTDTARRCTTTHPDAVAQRERERTAVLGTLDEIAEEVAAQQGLATTAQEALVDMTQELAETKELLDRHYDGTEHQITPAIAALLDDVAGLQADVVRELDALQAEHAAHADDTASLREHLLVLQIGPSPLRERP
eukprot:TRINITY_DN10424_c0_g1_i1.p1 TRINITY_DN10424_c0_g1~~TRINITY_DN10424_c0_g1_i1.p1  ORF type:complete len:1423 (+),score=423.86 TRINITY_DN10424_c0_g1_i1:168-4271(+)